MQTNSRKRRTWHDRGLCTGKEKAWPWWRKWHDRELCTVKNSWPWRRTWHNRELCTGNENNWPWRRTRQVRELCAGKENNWPWRRTRQVRELCYGKENNDQEGEQGRTENDSLARITTDHEGEQAKIEHDAQARTGHDGEQGETENNALARRTMTMKENMTWQRTMHWQGEQLAMKEKAEAWKRKPRGIMRAPPTCCTPSPPTSLSWWMPGTLPILSTSSRNTMPETRGCHKNHQLHWETVYVSKIMLHQDTALESVSKISLLCKKISKENTLKIKNRCAFPISPAISMQKETHQ